MDRPSLIVRVKRRRDQDPSDSLCIVEDSERRAKRNVHKVAEQFGTLTTATNLSNESELSNHMETMKHVILTRVETVDQQSNTDIDAVTLAVSAKRTVGGSLKSSRKREHSNTVLVKTSTSTLKSGGESSFVVVDLAQVSHALKEMSEMADVSTHHDGVTTDKKIAKTVILNPLQRKMDVAIAVAFENGDFNGIVEALDAGSSVHHQRSEANGGTTALMAAAKCCNLRMTRRLIGRGADVLAVDSRGETALDYARKAVVETSRLADDKVELQLILKRTGSKQFKQRAGSATYRQEEGEPRTTTVPIAAGTAAGTTALLDYGSQLAPVQGLRQEASNDDEDYVVDIFCALTPQSHQRPEPHQLPSRSSGFVAAGGGGGGAVGSYEADKKEKSSVMTSSSKAGQTTLPHATIEVPGMGRIPWISQSTKASAVTSPGSGMDSVVDARVQHGRESTTGGRATLRSQAADEDEDRYPKSGTGSVFEAGMDVSDEQPQSFRPSMGGGLGSFQGPIVEVEGLRIMDDGHVELMFENNADWDDLADDEDTDSNDENWSGNDYPDEEDDNGLGFGDEDEEEGEGDDDDDIDDDEGTHSFRSRRPYVDADCGDDDDGYDDVVTPVLSASAGKRKPARGNRRKGGRPTMDGPETVDEEEIAAEELALARHAAAVSGSLLSGLSPRKSGSGGLGSRGGQASADGVGASKFLQRNTSHIKGSGRGSGRGSGGGSRPSGARGVHWGDLRGDGDDIDVDMGGRGEGAGEEDLDFEDDEEDGEGGWAPKFLGKGLGQVLRPSVFTEDGTPVGDWFSGARDKEALQALWGEGDSVNEEEEDEDEDDGHFGPRSESATRAQAVTMAERDMRMFGGPPPAGQAFKLMGSALKSKHPSSQTTLSFSSSTSSDIPSHPQSSLRSGSSQPGFGSDGIDELCSDDPESQLQTGRAVGGLGGGFGIEGSVRGRDSRMKAGVLPGARRGSRGPGLPTKAQEHRQRLMDMHGRTGMDFASEPHEFDDLGLPKVRLSMCECE